MRLQLIKLYRTDRIVQVQPQHSVYFWYCRVAIYLGYCCDCALSKHQMNEILIIVVNPSKYFGGESE